MLPWLPSGEKPPGGHGSTVLALIRYPIAAGGRKPVLQVCFPCASLVLQFFGRRS